jgi:hypothetical protein
MTLDPVEGLPVEQRADTAANEDFTAIVNRRDSARREGGWDPFEVWRTRVHAPSRAAPGEKRPLEGPSALTVAPTR